MSTELHAKVEHYSQSVTIDVLPDDVLLEIFGICLCDPTSLPLEQTKQWQRLVHVCRRWRQITFPSPRRLDLRLSCSYDSEIPVRVKKNLKFWPLTMPLTINYPLRSLLPSPIDKVNIAVALKRSRRVHHIEVFASFTFLRKVVTIMRKSFPALTHLELGWDYKGIFEDVPVLPKGFLNKSAPCLQYLCLESFLFPEVPTFLLSSHNLVTLKLKKIFRNSFISPEAMVECLSGMTRLKTLSISFYCDDIDAFDQERTRPDLPTQIVLPSLIHFDYDGCSGYLENLVAQIDTPLLITLEITYHSDQIQNSHLSRFISHTENLKSYQFSSVQAWFWISEHEDNIVKLSCPQGKYPQASLSISLPRKVYLDLQLTNSFIGQLDMMFSNVNHLFLNGNSVHSSSIGDTDPEWLSFFRLFPAVKELRLSGGMGEEIVSVLEGTTEEMIPEILPALHVIWLDDENEDYEEEDYNEQMELGPMDLRQFHSLRQRSGHPVTIVDTQEEFEETLESHRSGQENVP